MLTKAKTKAREIATSEELTISSVQCKCGCVGYLTQKNVDLGRSFLYGHKLRVPINEGKVTHHDIAKQGRAPAVKTLSVTNWDSIERFIAADIEQQENRLETLDKELDEITARIPALTAEKEALSRSIEERKFALTILLPKKEKDARDS